MRGSLKGRNFVSMRDVTHNELAELIDTAADLKRMARAGIPHRSLEGKVLGMLFQKPSLRTRASFEVAMLHLGGSAVYMSPAEVGMGTREAVDDVAEVVSRYFDVICSRVFGHDIIAGLAEHASVPVINALSDAEHPCQILADLLTVQEWRGELRGQTLAYIGDGNNVAVSLAYGCAKVGMHFNIAAPDVYQLGEDVIAAFQAEAQSTGATFFQTTSPQEAVKDSHVIYTDVWTSMGQEDEREKRLKAFDGYLIDDDLVALGDDAIVLHCLPAHYGEEITREVTRSSRSAIWDQAENRLHAHKALLTLLT